MLTTDPLFYDINMKQIKGYPDYYANERGEIFSGKTSNFKKLKGTINSGGYFLVSIRNKNGVRRTRIHKLVAEVFLNKPKGVKDLVIHHKDGNKLNNHKDNLEWITNTENLIQGRFRKKTQYSNRIREIKILMELSGYKAEKMAYILGISKERMILLLDSIKN